MLIVYTIPPSRNNSSCGCTVPRRRPSVILRSRARISRVISRHNDSVCALRSLLHAIGVIVSVFVSYSHETVVCGGSARSVIVRRRRRRNIQRKQNRTSSAFDLPLNDVLASRVRGFSFSIDFFRFLSFRTPSMDITNIRRVAKL